MTVGTSMGMKLGSALHAISEADRKSKPGEDHESKESEEDQEGEDTAEACSRMMLSSVSWTRMMKG